MSQTERRIRRGRQKGKGAVMTPGEFDRAANQLIEQLARAAVAYRWSHASAFGKAVHGDGGGVRSGVSDQTGDIATSNPRDTLRYGMKVAGADLTDAIAAMREANYILDRAISAVDTSGSADLKLADQFRVSRAELIDSRAAKERRIERGEGWGEG